MPTTSRLSLRYPSTSDTADVPRDIGNLASDIDNAAIFSKGTFASRPTSTVGSPGIDGRYYFATDTSRLYLDTGTSWVEVASGTDSVTSAMIAVNAVETAELADGAVTAPKINSTVAGYLGLTSGATTRRWSLSAATERTSTSTTYVDVTGTSLSIDDVLGNLVVITVTAEIKNGTAGGYRAHATLSCDAPTGAAAAAMGNPSALGNFPLFKGGLGSFVTNEATDFRHSGLFSQSTTYQKASQTLIYVAPATRTTTVKLVQAADGSDGTADACYVKNVVINAWAITP